MKRILPSLLLCLLLLPLAVFAEGGAALRLVYGSGISGEILPCG